jgi:hypothetical protein
MRGKREEILEQEIRDGTGDEVMLVRVDHVRNTYLVFGDVHDVLDIERLLGKHRFRVNVPMKGEPKHLIGLIIDGNQGITEEVDDEREDA